MDGRGRARACGAAGPCRGAGCPGRSRSRVPRPRCRSWRWLSSLPGWRTSTSSRCHSVGVSRTSAPSRGHPAGGEVDGGVAECTTGCSSVSAVAAGHRAQPGEQLVHAERLGHVVVGAGVEGLDLVGAVGPAGQHQDRHVGPAAQPGDDLDAVHVGQAEVEDDDVGRVARPPAERLGPGGGGADLVAAGAQVDASGRAAAGVRRRRRGRGSSSSPRCARAARAAGRRRVGGAAARRPW